VKLTITIESDHGSMSEPEQAADTLRQIADKLEEGYTSGPVYDDEGACGNWTYDDADHDIGGPPAFEQARRRTLGV
jgi:hypothetical protein